MPFGYNSLSDQFKGYDGKLRQNKRKLSDRSHLTIEFPQSNDRVIRTFIPFLENPNISERGKALINPYSLVGRAGQLFSYGGAESRTLQVTFNISLLHVMEEEKDLADMFRSQFKLFFSEKTRSKQAFNISKPQTINPDEVENLRAQSGGLLSFEEAADLSYEIKSAAQRQEAREFIGDSDVSRGAEKNHASIHRDHYRMLVRGLTKQELDASDNETEESFASKISEFAGLGTLGTNIEKLNSTINLVFTWVNLIRGSVLNNSSNTVFGPPIVRLTHGPMYNNVPCLLQDYNINILEEGGYDAQTLTPKRLQITLNLIESRTGNFGKFSAGRIGDGDNITGWESVIETNNIDPYNGLIGSEDEEFGSLL
jgi:hypothetical protein